MVELFPGQTFRIQSAALEAIQESMEAMLIGYLEGKNYHIY